MSKCTEHTYTYLGDLISIHIWCDIKPVAERNHADKHHRGEHKGPDFDPVDLVLDPRRGDARDEHQTREAEVDLLEVGGAVES